MTGPVFFPGGYQVDGLGAVSVVTRNIFSGPSSQWSGAVLGFGRFGGGDVPPAFHPIDLLPEYLRRSAVLRAVSKGCRICFPERRFSRDIQRRVDDRQRVIVDDIAAKRVTGLLRSHPEFVIALGYVGESLQFGRAVKAAGRRFVVHSQFCHPHTQNAFVEDAYRSLGFLPPPVSPARLRRQIETIEIADAVWCCSEFSRRSLIENGVPAEKTFVSLLGIDVDRFHIPEENRIRNGPFTILFVGNIGIQKGVHVLLEALASGGISNAEVIFNGVPDMPGRRIIAEYTARLASRGISIRIDPGDPRRHFGRASVFVLPSVHDSFGIVVLEAMAGGLPVIVSDHAGAGEIVRDGENGFIFPSGNSRILAERLGFFRDNPAAREAFGRISEEIAADYDIRKTSARILTALVESVIMGEGGTG